MLDHRIRKRIPGQEEGIQDSSNTKIGKIHNNISKISSPRRLNPEEAEEMLDLYHRRCKGERVSQLAQEITVNQVYWYGIFAELGL